MAWIFESGRQGKKGWVFGEDNSDVTASGDSRSLEERIRARQREEERLKKQQEEYRAQQEEKEAARERENALATAQVMTGQQDENTAYTPIQLPIAESEEAAKPKYSFSDIVKLQQNMERGNAARQNSDEIHRQAQQRGNELMESTRLRNAASEVMAGQGLTDEERLDVYTNPAYTMTEKDKEQARRIISEFYDSQQLAPAFGKDAVAARRDALAVGDKSGKIALLEQKVNGSPVGYVAEKAAGGAAAALEGGWNMLMNLADAGGSAEGMASMGQSILELYRRGAITMETALGYADNPDQLRRRLGERL